MGLFFLRGACFIADLNNYRCAYCLCKDGLICFASTLVNICQTGTGNRLGRGFARRLQIDLFAPWFSSFFVGTLLRFIGVESHAAHCRMPTIKLSMRLLV